MDLRARTLDRGEIGGCQSGLRLEYVRSEPVDIADRVDGLVARGDCRRKRFLGADPALALRRSRLDADLVRSLRSNSGLASQLSFYQTVAGTWRYVVQARDRIAAVTADDVQRVAGQYLTRANRTVAVLVKKPAERKIAAGRMGEVAP